jgi:hypothetical protein
MYIARLALINPTLDRNLTSLPLLLVKSIMTNHHTTFKSFFLSLVTKILKLCEIHHGTWCV